MAGSTLGNSSTNLPQARNPPDARQTYAAASKGKVEALNKYLDKFVAEVKLKHPQSVAEVQHELDLWLSVFYQQKIHSALHGRTPEQAFRENRKELRFVTPDTLNFAFTTTEERLVDKTGCISFHFTALGCGTGSDRIESNNTVQPGEPGRTDGLSSKHRTPRDSRTPPQFLLFPEEENPQRYHGYHVPGSRCCGKEARPTENPAGRDKFPRVYGG